ncbi:NEDD8 ultimate buster 1-like [Leguminivora glycinivorella]|uniref:NEDD8 ultimate buster 1-like n=1 Tax=Leguminivora glycinivorella TaxID=1035111 RepID=UPI00200BD6A8|nr:NEDD8 ultimate buster 1-like [Leguminivora glycinivorella]
METNLQHEDLLIKLRAKLNEERIKLWESPFTLPDQSISESLKDLAKKFATELSLPDNEVLAALHELQLHSIDRSKANSEFAETGLATLRVKATVPGQKPQVLRIQQTLESVGKGLIESVAKVLDVSESRVKLIHNGKVIQPAPSLEEQGVKNGVQIMALIMPVNPEEAKKEDRMYLEMKSTRDDAMLLSEYADDFEDEEYIKLEDQSGKTVELPKAERRALMVGLALHERGRAAAKKKDYPLALVLLLEADRQLSECSSSILASVDNVAVLQLDIAWCYLCLQSLAAAGDAAARLARAERALKRSYGEDHGRVLAVKGTDANERALMMRLHLLQGIVSFHQNKRDEARRLLEKAETELNSLRVDDGAVSALMELGWSMSAARRGLRAARGDVAAAHHYLADASAARDTQRRRHKRDRERKALGVCVDGTPVNAQLVEALVGMGYARRLATLALRSSNNHVAEGVRLIQEQPELLEDSEIEEDADVTESASSDESFVEPDNKLVAELEAMGYSAEDAKDALKRSHNHISGAVDLLVAGKLQPREAMDTTDAGNPSTSTASTAKKEKHGKRKKDDKKKREREQALNRLTSVIQNEEDDHLDTSLVDEEDFLAQYKSLL